MQKTLNKGYSGLGNGNILSELVGIKDQDFSKEDITQNESLETIEEIISNSFDEDFDEQEYNKKRRMRR